MNAVIYARFSSDKQNEMSIEAQLRACNEYAKEHQINIIDKYIDEAITGRTANRISYQQMLADAFEGKFDMVLIHKYDRIARSLEEQVSLSSKLKSLNIKLIAVAQDYGEGKEANLSKGIQWVLGEYYSANLSEETKKGHKEVALRGLHNGGYPPFGYDVVDQKYVINKLEAKYVKKLFKACLKGESYTDILTEMLEIGLKGKRGKEIKYTQVYEMLHNEKYTGVYIYTMNEEPERSNRRSKPNAIRIEGAIPQIIDKETFAEVQKILDSRKHAGAHKHRCSGMVYCKECGAKMHLSQTVRRGHHYYNFRCAAKCGAHGVPVSLIDDAVDAYLDKIFGQKNIPVVEAAIIELKRNQIESEKQFQIDKKKRLEKAHKELDKILQGFASGKFDDNYELCNKLMTEKRIEIERLEAMKQTYISDKKIRNWMENIIKSNYAPSVFIDRIEAATTSVEIFSTFTDVVGNTGCGGTIENILTTFKFSVRKEDEITR